ncbi:MAG: hypothetical protein A2528_00575 [Candidatus Staskawiczbacteria bacterium RIFOXYD2_FULL_37_9]|uniref:histidine kinase n=1 Tax=Candidatus Staskawiczbacteria bacterium RIFOXYB1_FULL_37_44 TaxID=1802223 RepID=A0A1G2IW97_9BACT|nr:MAG: hypothetical protein A2358_04005 [Candidatus Staskawiczbacteria bacterium RIFOXYB1_FULL_37_44]OGZ83795.1 MAG: hypothetical protein A2416_00240 [Candidatus Staskawiczbacteria bacterium RIFOXYC1_FULL_37_52]OGZ88944.1 MAG: hypothetical protein A2581_01730 [Candidatus Staskawiczbacteria bacterium RIFOXYD1_FULL_37_110]OGZ89587.1 MAG: hypothetical protein A2444_01475 [Candidatus Staskawiczbacteria bacterium RIFOXYC2_FULL_37_19]OGZ93274.1 MAG: hypothetical protein A2528_00575 [Candidatus Stask
MTAEVLIIAIISILIILVIAGIFTFQKNKKFEKDLIKREKSARRKMYEIAILNELGDKVGYSLNVQNIAEMIIGSLRQFIEYSAASYMLFYPEKIIFRTYIEKPVSHKFIRDIKEKMLNSAGVLLNADFKNTKIDEALWGSNLSNEANDSVGSFFNIPLAISGKTVGLVTVASKESGFYKEEEIDILYKISQQATEAVMRLQMVVEQEKSKLNAMVASMADGVIMTDMDFKVLVVNPAARKVAGSENKSDPSIADFTLCLRGKFDLRDKIEESIRLEKVFVSDEISLHSGFFQIIISPVKDRWKSLGCVIVFRDITREKEIQKIKDDFTSMIVHELRSPLDSIKKMIELIRMSEVKKQKQEECFKMIYSSSSDMLSLVNNILDVAKIEAGKFELVKQPSDIKETVKRRISFFDIAAKDAKVELISQFGKDLPDKVEFDPHMISEVLNNLISNAIKFNKKNGSIIIQVLVHKNGKSIENEAKDSKINWFIKNDITAIPDSLIVAVTDTGAGIASEQINKLFNKFFQVKSAFAQKGGTGLGLAIIKSIVESHGGVVGAESVEGQGATFYFSLPINAAEIRE